MNGNCHLASVTTICDRFQHNNRRLRVLENVADATSYSKKVDISEEISLRQVFLFVCIVCREVCGSVWTLLNQSDKIINNDFGIDGRAIDESKFGAQFYRVVWHALTFWAWTLGRTATEMFAVCLQTLHGQNIIEYGINSRWIAACAAQIQCSCFGSWAGCAIANIFSC